MLIAWARAIVLRSASSRVVLSRSLPLPLSVLSFNLLEGLGRSSRSLSRSISLQSSSLAIWNSLGSRLPALGSRDAEPAPALQGLPLVPVTLLCLLTSLPRKGLVPTPTALVPEGSQRSGGPEEVAGRMEEGASAGSAPAALRAGLRGGRAGGELVEVGGVGGGGGTSWTDEVEALELKKEEPRILCSLFDDFFSCENCCWGEGWAGDGVREREG